MARSPEDLRRLAQELASLTPDERARFLAEGWQRFLAAQHQSVWSPRLVAR